MKSILINSNKEYVDVTKRHEIFNENGGDNYSKNIIEKGKNQFIEFKSSILWSTMFSEEKIKESKSIEVKRYGRNASKFIIAKSIAGFLNSDGGDLVIGIKENKRGDTNEVIGIESELFKIQDPCNDGYRRMIVDQIIKVFLPSNIFNHFNRYLKIKIVKLEGKTVCFIHVNISDPKVFMTIKNKEHFFVRIDATTRELLGEEIVDYCIKRFV